MANGPSVVVSAAVEGVLDEAVAGKLIHELGAELGPVYGKRGKGHLREKIGGYNNAARFSPWLTLVDLDQDHGCAPPLRSSWVPRKARSLSFRIAVRAVEAWLLADSEAMAHFLGVALSQIPSEPEGEPRPKRRLIDLARRSRRTSLRADLVPRAGSGREVGPGYTSRMIECVQDHWRPQVAAERSESLGRCLRELTMLIADVA